MELSESSPITPPTSPNVSPIRLSDCVDDLIRFTLSSFLDGTLEIYLPFSKDYCSNILQPDPHPLLDPHLASIGSLDGSRGVPFYPLYRHLGKSIIFCIESGMFLRHYVSASGMPGSTWLTGHEDDWMDKIGTIGLRLINMFENIGFELHVQEPFFTQLKAGLKSVEGRCAVGNYNRIVPGALLLFNKCLLLQVQKVKWYRSFAQMLETETLTVVLPGVITLEEGVQIYRRFYSEEKEMSNGVLAISVCRPSSQPHIVMANLLSVLGYEGIACLLGMVHTIGTIRDALPPPPSALIRSFTTAYKPEIKVSHLTTGARALAKHSHRGSEGWWGNFVGSDLEKNSLALGALNTLMTSCCWMNIHFQSHEEVFEIRVADGYGARWSRDGTKFIGFLEPYMADGYSKAWKH